MGCSSCRRAKLYRARKYAQFKKARATQPVKPAGETTTNKGLKVLPTVVQPTAQPVVTKNPQPVAKKPVRKVDKAQIKKAKEARLRRALKARAKAKEIKKKQASARKPKANK